LFLSSHKNDFNDLYQYVLNFKQGWTDHWGSAAIAAKLFSKNAWHFKDTFREFENFLKISTVFEDICREIETLF
jgi:hypothetical protein